MELEEYARCDAVGLAQLIADGEVSAAEVQSCALRAIDRLDPQLNFISGALDRSPSWTPGAPFSGVPFLVKEGHGTKGFAAAQGSRLCAGVLAPEDAPFTTRLRAAGVAILGATTAPEFGIYPVTESGLHGASRNPWSLEHSPGGSSGGSSAAVAAGVVPVAQTSDGGGSIRGPAHCCGIFGLKPSRGRTPGDGGLFGFPHINVSSRSVRDSAAFLDQVQGPSIGARYWIAPPERPYLEETRREPGRLRIGFCRVSPGAVPLAPECRAAVEETARLLESMGHDIEEASPALAWERLFRSFASVWAHPLPLAVQLLCKATGRQAGPDTLDAQTLQLLEHAARLSVNDLMVAEAAFREARVAVDRYFASFDLWLSPTGVSQAPRVGAYDPTVPVADAMASSLQVLHEYAAFTPLFNVTGHPAASIPVVHGTNGLPVGVQIAAPMGGEAAIFRVAAALEQARPWAGRIPPYSIFQADRPTAEELA